MARDAQFSNRIVAIRFTLINTISYPMSEILVSNQASDPDGWWRLSFLSSQITLPKNQQYISLRPNEQIVAAFVLERIIRGMRNSAVEADQLCEYQMRLDLQYEDLASGSATFLSGWKSVDCRSILVE